MKEVKVSELQGIALDYAVAEAIGWKEPFYGIGGIHYIEEERHQVKTQFLLMDTPDPDEPEDVTEPQHFNHHENWAPSRFWSQGGPLIEAKKLAAHYDFEDGEWIATDFNLEEWVAGDTPLIAACRAIVAAKLGDVVQIPDQLEG